MTAEELKAGDIVQLNPKTVTNNAFSGCFMVVTDPKPFGAMGYIQGMGTRVHPGSVAYYRATWAEMEHTDGRAVWGEDIGG